MAVLLITHDLGIVAGFAQHVVVLRHGRVVERGDTDDIYYRPAHPYACGLLGAIPRIDADPAVRLAPVEEVSLKIATYRGGLRVVSYRVTLDVPRELVTYLSVLLAGHRRELGTRRGTRALTCWKQAVFALAWFRDRPDIPRLGKGFGLSQPPPTGTSMRSSRSSPPGLPAWPRPWMRPESRSCRT